jgi:phosphohistidine phosphatase
MELFIIRHAPAVPRREGKEDEQRPLTGRGRERFERAVEGLEVLGVRFDRLLHSPWKRAVETAKLLKPLVDGRIIATQNLAVLPRPALLEQLRGPRVGVVGHEPWLTQLLAWLTLGDPQFGTHFELKKGAVAWLEGTAKPEGMQLKALFTPKALRLASRTRPR